MERGPLTLILGGEKSGKSDYALRLLARAPGPGLFVATGRALDAGFRAQIQAHRAGRGPEIPVREVGTDLPEALAQAAGRCGAVLVDSLDFWLFACRAAGDEPARVAALLAALDAMGPTEVIVVSCEIGLGPVAPTAGVRAFVRALGALNRQLAQRSARAVLVVAGRALTLPED
jgi:adenosylcobinamide kinase/adenosylcobinamide-phosphate guanylyltransferase